MGCDVLTCRGIGKTFTVRNRSRTVLAGLSLTLGRGEILTISGKSGAGKTTLLSILSGLEQPTCGEVVLFGINLQKSDESTLAALRGGRTGFLFQNHNLIPSWTAFENVEAVFAHTQCTGVEIRESVNRVFAQLGIADLTDHLPAQMSAGEQQRVALARAIVHRPELIFADEPVADVDPATGGVILGILGEMVARDGVSIVFVTHGQPPAGFDLKVVTLQDGAFLTAD